MKSRKRLVEDDEELQDASMEVEEVQVLASDSDSSEVDDIEVFEKAAEKNLEHEKKVEAAMAKAKAEFGGLGR